jgi:hypothetical protein
MKKVINSIMNEIEWHYVDQLELDFRISLRSELQFFSSYMIMDLIGKEIQEELE